MPDLGLTDADVGKTILLPVGWRCGNGSGLIPTSGQCLLSVDEGMVVLLYASVAI